MGVCLGQMAVQAYCYIHVGTVSLVMYNNNNTYHYVIL